MSVLEKSKLDWSSFKKAEGIEEDLKQHSGSRSRLLSLIFLILMVEKMAGFWNQLDFVVIFF